MGNLKNIKREDTEQSRLPFRIQKKCLSLPWSKKEKDFYYITAKPKINS